MATNASFGAADFDVLWGNPFTVPLPPRRHVLNIRHVPWGSRTIIQDLGTEPVEQTYRIQLTRAEYAALAALIGTTATLDVDGDEARSGVLLQSLSDIERDDTNDLVTLTASFLVLT